MGSEMCIRDSLKIAKQKEGRLGTWPMAFDGAHQRFGPLPVELQSLVSQQKKVKGSAGKKSKATKATGEKRPPEAPPADSRPLEQLSFQEIQDSGDEPF